MTPYTFRGYGVGGPDVTIILERITHWWPIYYNGNHGTEIVLDTGKTIRVAEYPDAIQDIVTRRVKHAHAT